MVFRTVDIQKRSSGTNPKCCDYTFRFYIDGEHEKICNVMQDTVRIFDSYKIYNGKCTILREENEISVCIKNFSNRKKRKLERDLKAFSDRLLEMTGTWYIFKI